MTRQTVTYEASYLPFLYPPSSHGDDKNLTPQPNISGPSQVKFMGRRVFGKEGREVSVRPNYQEISRCLVFIILTGGDL